MKNVKKSEAKKAQKRKNIVPVAEIHMRVDKDGEADLLVVGNGANLVALVASSLEDNDFHEIVGQALRIRLMDSFEKVTNEMLKNGKKKASKKKVAKKRK